jgi:hypothetical protein
MLDLPAAGGRHDVPPVAAPCGSLAATSTNDAERFSIALRGETPAEGLATKLAA